MLGTKEHSLRNSISEKPCSREFGLFLYRGHSRKPQPEQKAPRIRRRDMKGNPKIIEVLNSLLADELTAINQYVVHAEMCENWGYEKLHNSFMKRALDEMKHAESLIKRILFLEGIPIVSVLREMKIGSDVPKQLENDRSLEEEAIKAYNEAIKLSAELGDYATRSLLEEILKDEDKHIDEIESFLDEIQQMGLPMFLSTKVKKEEK